MTRDPYDSLVSRSLASTLDSYKRLTDMAYGSQMIAPKFPDVLRASFAGTVAPSRIADVFGTSKLAETFGPSYLADVLGTRQKLVDLMGTSKFAATFEPPKFASVLVTQQSVRAKIVVGTFSDTISLQSRVAERITKQYGATLAQPFKTTDLFAQQQRLAERLSLQTNYTDLFKSSRFTNLMDTFTVPRVEWSSLLSDLAAAVDDTDAFAEFAAELDEADAATELDDSQDTGWVYRLPLVQQYLLYVAAIKIVDEVSKFMADLADVDVPAEMRSGIQVLFAVVGFLLLVMEAQSKPLED